MINKRRYGDAKEVVAANYEFIRSQKRAAYPAYDAIGLRLLYML